MKYANQTLIVVHKETTNGKGDNIYAKINKKALIDAQKDLGNNASYGLWIYLASNQDGYNYGFSPAFLEEELGMSRATVYNARKKLIEKGYLVQQEQEYKYYFYERPKMAEAEKPNIEKIENYYDIQNRKMRVATPEPEISAEERLALGLV